MNLTHLKNKVTAAFIASGYARTAKELSKLTNAQLNDIGLSRDLLNKGAKAYPWRADAVVSQVIPRNVTSMKTRQVVMNTPIMPQTPKAA